MLVPSSWRWAVSCVVTGVEKVVTCIYRLWVSWTAEPKASRSSLDDKLRWRIKSKVRALYCFLFWKDPYREKHETWRLQRAVDALAGCELRCVRGRKVARGGLVGGRKVYSQDRCRRLRNVPLRITSNQIIHNDDTQGVDVLLGLVGLAVLFCAFIRVLAISSYTKHALRFWRPMLLYDRAWTIHCVWYCFSFLLRKIERVWS